MQDSLRLFSSMSKQMRKFLPHERITRVENLTLLVTSLFLAGSVHLDRLVRKWPLAAKTTSLTNRLRRFLSNMHVEAFSFYEPVARLLLNRFTATGGDPDRGMDARPNRSDTSPIRLILDATKLGTGHRLLTVCIAYRRRALPLAWSVHRGSSGVVSNEATLRLLERLAPLVPLSCKVVVLGDSGFGHVPVMQWLLDHKWDFVLRLRGTYYVKPQGGAWCRVRDFKPEWGRSYFVGAVLFTDAYMLGSVHLVTHWAEGEDEPWYLLSSSPGSPQTLRLYGVRMWTEGFYGDLKRHGFDLEATQLRRHDRLERLVLGVFYAYVWLIALGASVVKRGLRHLVDRRERRDRSYFRLGWDYLERRLCLGEPIPIRFEPCL